MSKFTMAARIVELNHVNTACNSRALSPVEVEETLLQHFLKVWRTRSAAHLTPVPVTSIDPQPVEEKSIEPVPNRASPYDLASNNPHVIAATLFSRKR